MIALEHTELWWVEKERLQKIEEASPSKNFPGASHWPGAGDDFHLLGWFSLHITYFKEFSSEPEDWKALSRVRRRAAKDHGDIKICCNSIVGASSVLKSRARESRSKSPKVPNHPARHGTARAADRSGAASPSNFIR